MIVLSDVFRGVQTGSHPHETTFANPTDAQRQIAAVAIDSRLVVRGALFVALAGARVDGHTFVDVAAHAGADYALVDAHKGASLASEHGWTLVSPGGVVPATWYGPLLIAVPNPLHALHQLARWHRARLHPTWVVGITGSVGKTSTKEVVAALLQTHLTTLKSPRSYNSESTLPLVALELTATHQAAVFEMGMYAAGEIALLADIAQPNIGVVTAVGPSHLERMGSIEAIAAAKAELVQALPAAGVAVLNRDDERVYAMRLLTAARVMSYGLHAEADVRASDIRTHGIQGTTFVVTAPGIHAEVLLRAPGLHQVRNLLAGIAVGVVAGVPWAHMAHAIAHDIEQLRFVVRQGMANTQIIDDAYNAAPTSMQAALELLATVPARRVAVLGDMRELGHIEVDAHHAVGRHAAQAADVLVAVGDRGAWIADGARQAGMTTVYTARDTVAAIAVVQSVLQAGDCVLVKGSRAMEMERIVAACCID
ncbi:MAG: UDP-N-acetylmuramoyl-tripeptide--D-alanyl-D-alanine ligase [Roseiflexaceae bacterium]